jgi:hypothetical protein
MPAKEGEQAAFFGLGGSIQQGAQPTAQTFHLLFCVKGH